MQWFRTPAAAHFFAASQVGWCFSLGHAVTSIIPGRHCSDNWPGWAQAVWHHLSTCDSDSETEYVPRSFLIKLYGFLIRARQAQGLCAQSYVFLCRDTRWKRADAHYIDDNHQGTENTKRFGRFLGEPTKFGGDFARRLARFLIEISYLIMIVVMPLVAIHETNWWNIDSPLRDKSQPEALDFGRKLPQN